MLDKIIKILKKTNGYLSGEDISRDFKISRSAVWKNIEELRKQGYDIIAVPHCGYKLNTTPDKLFSREIAFGLKTKLIGKKIIHFESIPSTMDETFRLGVEGLSDGSVICAEHQAKGKGRLGRSWISPKGKGVYMSILLRPKLSPTDVAQLTLLTAVAVCEAINQQTGLCTKIKWPNDILIGNKKIAGILTEMSAEMDRVRFCVIGIGINVNTTATLLPDHATSIKNELGTNFSRIKLTQKILENLEMWYVLHEEKGFDPIIKKWKSLSATLGKRVKILDSYETIEGKAIDLDRDGGLIIRKDSGVAVKKISGDVIQV